MKVLSNTKTMTIVIIAIACLIAHMNAKKNNIYSAFNPNINYDTYDPWDVDQTANKFPHLDSNGDGKFNIHDIKDWDQKHSLLGSEKIIVPDDHSQLKNIFSADNYTLFDVMYLKSVHSPVCDASDQDCLVNFLKF